MAGQSQARRATVATGGTESAEETAQAGPPVAHLFIERGVPAHIRSDNGPEFTAKAVRRWLGRVGVSTLFIEPGSPWGDGYIESFNGKFRDEFLDREVFDTPLEAKILIERWRRDYNTIRPHSALGYRPPAPEAIMPVPSGSGALRLPAPATGSGNGPGLT